MNFTNRYGVSSNAKTAETCKTWSIGWTVGEATSAAQRQHSENHAAPKRGSAGTTPRSKRR